MKGDIKMNVPPAVVLGLVTFGGLVLRKYLQDTPSALSTSSESTPHQEARAGYKKDLQKAGLSRTELSDEQVPWKNPLPTYNPVSFTHENVLKNFETKQGDKQNGGWADSPDPKTIDFNNRHSYLGDLYFDKHGNPLNPMGRTGLQGRGLLGQWGPNHAADPIVMRDNNGSQEVLLIQRRDTGDWALPGGMVEYGDSVSITVRKELKEEACALGTFSQEDKEIFDAISSLENTPGNSTEFQTYFSKENETGNYTINPKLQLSDQASFDQFLRRNQLDEANIAEILQKFQLFIKNNTLIDSYLDNKEILTEVYTGYVDDPRNTDNAWMETSAQLIFLPSKISTQLQIKPGDDAGRVRWFNINNLDTMPLYASHNKILQDSKQFITTAIAKSRTY